MRFDKSAEEITAQTERLIAGTTYEPLKETLRQSLKIRLAIREAA